MCKAAGCCVPLRWREVDQRGAIAPVDAVTRACVCARIDYQSYEQGVDTGFAHRDCTRHFGSRRHVVDRDLLVLHRDTAITIVDRHADRVHGRVHRPIFVVGKGVLDVA